MTAPYIEGGSPQGLLRPKSDPTPFMVRGNCGMLLVDARRHRTEV